MLVVLYATSIWLVSEQVDRLVRVCLFFFSESNSRHSIILLLCKHIVRLFIFPSSLHLPTWYFVGAHEEGKMVRMDCRFFQEEEKGGQLVCVGKTLELHQNVSIPKSDC